MPNWTSNRLTVEGEPAALGVFVEAVRSEERDDDGARIILSFERHLPTPPELLRDSGADKAEAEDPRPEWLLWRREHWGTKWDAQWPHVIDSAESGSITYEFGTAWSPPDAWLHKVSEAHPELRSTHEYVEEFAHFAGRGVWLAGVLIEHEQLDPYEIEWIEWESLDEDE